MTEQEAAKILRTEQIGDSEQMELAKQMGANALDGLPLRFIAPVCGHCGNHLLGVAVRHLENSARGNIYILSQIDPDKCPRCGTRFVALDIDYERKICIARGEEDLKNAN